MNTATAIKLRVAKDTSDMTWKIYSGNNEYQISFGTKKEAEEQKKRLNKLKKIKGKLTFES
jgi:hypothetical protein